MEIRDIQTDSIDYNGHTIYFPIIDELNYILYNGFTYYYNDSYLLEKSNNRVKDKYLKRVARNVFKDIESNEIWQFTEPLPYPDGLYRQSNKLVNVTRDIKHTIPDAAIDMDEVSAVKESFRNRQLNKMNFLYKESVIDNIYDKLQDKLYYFEFILYIVFSLCLGFGLICIEHEPLIKTIWFLPCFMALGGSISIGLHNLLNILTD